MPASRVVALKVGPVERFEDWGGVLSKCYRRIFLRAATKAAVGEGGRGQTDIGCEASVLGGLPETAVVWLILGVLDSTLDRSARGIFDDDGCVARGLLGSEAKLERALEEPVGARGLE